MFINEYGDKNNPLFLLLAPMMVSGEDMYQLMHPYFKHDYHYITLLSFTLCSMKNRLNPSNKNKVLYGLI